MTEKKTAAKKEVNKSEEIRKVANAMKARNEKPRPVKIIEILKKQGVVVSSPQVSMVLKKMGFRPRRRRKAGETVAVAGPKTARKGGRISVEDLVAAKRIVSKFGTAERALAAIQALQQFES